MTKLDEVITVKAESPAYGGFSLARGRGSSLLLIRNAIPGETVAAKIERRRDDFALASAVKIFAASPDRIQPRCRTFGSCGNCHNQYISYGRQVSLKEEILADCVSRMAGKDVDLSKAFLGDGQWRFKYRGRFKLSGGSIGFFGMNSKEVVDIDACPLMRDEVNALYTSARHIYKASPKLFEGVSDIHISYGDGGLALLKYCTRMSEGRMKQIGALLLKAGFEGVCITSEKNKGISLGSENVPLGLDGLKYTISPRSFFQGHWDLNKAIVSFLKQSLRPLKNKRVVILYGGGIFSLPLAFDGADVFSVGEDLTEIEDGRRNAAANGIRNCRFIECSAERLKISDRVDAFVVVPPRSGLSNVVIEKMLSIEPAKIAYLSSHPESLARDLKKLLGRYDVESMRVVDCLPHAYQIKSITILKLR